MSEDTVRKTGRPPLPPEKKRDVKLQVYLTERERDLLYALAYKSRQDVSSYVRMLCRQRIWLSLRREQADMVSVTISTPSS